MKYNQVVFKKNQIFWYYTKKGKFFLMQEIPEI